MFFKLKILYFMRKLRSNVASDRSVIEQIQKRRFQKLLRQLKKSPFYLPFIKTTNTSADFPIMNKQTFMENFSTINTKHISLVEASKIAIVAERSRNFNPMIDGVTVGLSTGTSGNRGVFLADENDRAKWVAAILDRVIGISIKKRSVAFFLRANSTLYTAVKSSVLQFEFFDILKPVEVNLDKLNQLNPDILVAQPSMLCLIAKAKEKGLLKIRPQKIISVAEVLEPEDRAYLSKIFEQTIHQVYQCTEGFLAATCNHGTLHFNEDFLIIEKKYIDEEQKRFHPVITDLLRFTQPVVRYELNDIITEKVNCPCGNKMMGIESIEGRSDDILTFIDNSKNKVLFFPDAFRKAIVLAHEKINDYALIQKDANNLVMYINGEVDVCYEAAEIAVRKLLKERNIESVHLNKLEHNPHRLGEKKRRIKNESK